VPCGPFLTPQGFDEVDTPVLQVCPVMDAHIRAFGDRSAGSGRGGFPADVSSHQPGIRDEETYWWRGWRTLYQICPVFRNAEGSPRHSPEFTILEWYRAGADYTDIMTDCEGLLRAVATALGVSKFKHKNLECDPFEPFDRISVERAFKNLPISIYPNFWKTHQD
jgi:lysyl-tRNA synthetase class 2